jgi:hypothetical protein
MQANARSFWPEAPRWAERLHQRRTPEIPRRGRELVLRRLAWAQALWARFAHPTAGVSVGEGTLLRRVRGSLLRFWYFAPQMRVAWETSMATIFQGRDRTIFQTAVPRLANRGVLQAVSAREYLRQSTMLLSAGFIRNSLQHQLQEVTRHASASVLGMRPMAPSATAPDRLGATMAVQRRAVAEDLRNVSLVTRLRQQNRRIEEPARPARTVLLNRSSPVVRESSFVGAGALQQVRSTGAHGAWAAAPAALGFNISQITDEVVRRLDNRLVAARERFGKI